MLARSGGQRGFFDAAWCTGLLPERSIYALLAEHGQGALVTVRLDHDAELSGPFDRGADPAKVVALRDFLGGLVQRVVGFLALDLADDVERGISQRKLLKMTG